MSRPPRSTLAPVLQEKCMNPASVLRKPRIAIFDYAVRRDRAMGGCHLRMLEGLADKYDFTVFAVEFENPAPARINFVRIPAPSMPAILLCVVFHLLAPLYYYMYRLKYGVRFDLVEKMETYTCIGDIAYIHFCYRAYRKHWAMSRQPGLRGLVLSFDHMLRAYFLEPVLYRFVRKLLVPSKGLARELIEAYPFTETKIHLLPNSADYTRLSTVPPDFDRDSFRARFGFSSDDLVLVFVALGHFERKGLPQLLDAIALVGTSHVKLLMVGGSIHWMEHYRLRAEELRIGKQLAFAGMQRDIAPFLWASDVCVLPSIYETFALVVLEAAAAGCAILVTRLHGVEDYIGDGTSGIYVDRTARSIANGLRAMDAMGVDGRRKLGKAAQRAASRYSVEAFVANWDEFLAEQLDRKQHGSEPSLKRAEYTQH